MQLKRRAGKQTSKEKSPCSDVEDSRDYRRGGYHPVDIGETYCDGRYLILRKLGWGHFSTVWLAKNTKNGCYVAIKFVKSEKRYTEAALDEIKLLEKTSDPILRETKLSERNLLGLIKEYGHNGIPIPMVKAIAKDVLEGLDYLHSHCNIIHTDLKPENVLLCLDPEEIQMLAGDTSLEMTMKNMGLNSPTPLSISKYRTLPIDHVAQIIELVGVYPRTLAKGKFANEIFNKRGEIRGIKELHLWDLRDVLMEKYKFSIEDAEEITRFLMPMLEIDIRKRASAAECLRSTWFTPSEPKDKIFNQ
ncbi:unnamed protein product [Sphagnum compactum]